MVGRLIFFYAVVFFLFSLKAYSRPVSYTGGATMMQMNKAKEHSLHIHYSPSAFWSLGYRWEWLRQENRQLQGAQLNLLIKRWNNKRSQANIYLKSFWGLTFQNVSESKKLEAAPAGFIGLQADWENRRFYTAYENRFYYLYHQNILKQSFRIGLAPYLADYGGFHTFLIVEVEVSGNLSIFDKNTQPADVLIIPMLRFFKGDYLIEMGLSHKKDAALNIMARF